MLYAAKIAALERHCFNGIGTVTGGDFNNEMASGGGSHRRSFKPRFQFCEYVNSGLPVTV